MEVVVGVLAVAVALLGVIVFGLLRTHASILRALARAGISLDDGVASSPPQPVGPVPVGAPRGIDAAVDVVGTVPGGGPVKVAVAGTAHTTLLAFLSSGCTTCAAFWETFARPGLELPGADTRLVIVGQDPEHDSESRLAELAPPGVRTVCSTATWQAYDIPGSPFFVLVDGPSARIVGSGTATSWDQVANLLTQALGDAGLATSRTAAASPTGGAAPRSTDEALKAAGIGPGHPSLWPDRDPPS